MKCNGRLWAESARGVVSWADVGVSSGCVVEPPPVELPLVPLPLPTTSPLRLRARRPAELLVELSRDARRPRSAKIAARPAGPPTELPSRGWGDWGDRGAPPCPPEPSLAPECWCDEVCCWTWWGCWWEPLPWELWDSRDGVAGSAATGGSALVDAFAPIKDHVSAMAKVTATRRMLERPWK